MHFKMTPETKIAVSNSSRSISNDQLLEAFKEVLREYAPRKNIAREARELVKRLQAEPKVLEKFLEFHKDYPKYDHLRYRDSRAELLAFPFKILVSVYLNDKQNQTQNLATAVERLHSLTVDNRRWDYLRSGLLMLAEGDPKNLDIVELGNKVGVHFFDASRLSSELTQTLTADALSLTGQSISGNFYLWENTSGISDGVFVTGQDAYQAFQTLLYPAEIISQIKPDGLKQVKLETDQKSIFEILKDLNSPRKQSLGASSLRNRTLEEINRVLAELVKENKKIIENLINSDGVLAITSLGPFAFNVETGTFASIVEQYYSSKDADQRELPAYYIVKSGNTNSPLYGPALAIVAARYTKQVAVSEKRVLEQLDEEIQIFDSLEPGHFVAQALAKFKTKKYHELRNEIGGSLDAVSLFEVQALFKSFPFNKFRAEMNRYALAERGYESLTHLLSRFTDFYFDEAGKYNSEGISDRLENHLYTAKNKDGKRAVSHQALTQSIRKIFSAAGFLENLSNVFALFSPRAFKELIRDADLALRQAFAVDLQIDAIRDGVFSKAIGNIPISKKLSNAELNGFDPNKDGLQIVDQGLIFLDSKSVTLAEARERTKLNLPIETLLAFVAEFQSDLPSSVKDLTLSFKVGLVPEKLLEPCKIKIGSKFKEYTSYLEFFASKITAYTDLRNISLSSEEVDRLTQAAAGVEGLFVLNASLDSQTFSFSFTEKTAALLEQASKNPLLAYNLGDFSSFQAINQRRWMHKSLFNLSVCERQLRVAAAQANPEMREVSENKELMRRVNTVLAYGLMYVNFTAKGDSFILGISQGRNLLDEKPESYEATNLKAADAKNLIAKASEYTSLADLPKHYARIFALLHDKAFMHKGVRDVAISFEKDTYFLLARLAESGGFKPFRVQEREKNSRFRSSSAAAPEYYRLHSSFIAYIESLEPLVRKHFPEVFEV
ncbi:MAG: hypothetical protein R3A13_12475 [Bdellovibrionota bacterium]